MKFVDLENGIILNGIEQGNYIEYPNITVLDDEFKITQSEFVLIDDQLVVPILILNKKGYKTEYCCSGHIEENAVFSYIRFVEPIFKYKGIIEPNGINLRNLNIIQIDEDLRTIRVSNKINKENLSLIDINKYINEFCDIILKWAMELPDREKVCRTIRYDYNKKIVDDGNTMLL